jgi:hypothetical protein
MWFGENFMVVNWEALTIKKIDPMITCNPWNPVATKNVDPHTESHIENGACQYSIPWSVVKYNPSKTVKYNLLILLFRFFNIIEWCAQVTDTPEDNKIIVFKRGIFIGLNNLIPIGGHTIPNSGVGEILLWKNAQKNEKKNNTSETINKITPILIPKITRFGWDPSNVDSRNTSRHHWIDEKIVDKKQIIKGV